MTYSTIYEYSQGSSGIGIFSIILPLILIIIICFFLIRFKRYYMQEQKFLKRIIIFTSYLGLFLANIFLIIILVQLPDSIKESKEISEILINEDYKVVEGKVDEYSIKEINGQYFESFKIDDKDFSYSDYVITIGYNQTAKKGGVIKGNDMQLKISYIDIDNKNYIIKIETPVSK